MDKFNFIRPININEHLEQLKKHYLYQEELITKLEEQNQRLKSESYKDEELSSMKWKLDKMEKEYYRNGFPISDDEKQQIDNWCHEHYETYHRGMIAYGNYTYEFACSPVGTVGFVKCACGEKFQFRNV